MSSADRYAAAEYAAERAHQLILGMGMPPLAAARHVARRLAIDPHAVLDRLGPTRVLDAWRTGDRRRATSRPMDRNARAALEADEQEETGT